MAFQPKIYGRIKDDTDPGVESGTLTLTPYAFEFTQNSDYHPNGNAITWKFKGTLAELRNKANTISQQQTELGTLGTRHVVTMNYRGIGGFTAGVVEDGIASAAEYYMPEYSSRWRYLVPVLMASVPTKPIRQTNPHNQDGGATMALTRLEYTWLYQEGEEEPTNPPYLLVYGKYADSNTFFYIGSLQYSTAESTTLKAVYEAQEEDLRFESYYALYLVPVTDADNPALSVDGSGIKNNLTTITPQVKAVFPKLATWRAYLGSTQYSEYFRCPTFTGNQAYVYATLGSNEEGGMKITYNTEYRVYKADPHTPLYECTVQKTYYSYSPSNAHRVQRKTIS